ncbi:AraC family transcriptional regulator [Niastella caeni]|uniref:AraC family transcriptional regulator n=1 Tax=Niastella caeni TaxID=2569763 RepID=A0A4S8HA11_9BACT|nr:helix-turn-helix domain-containing protein [Niastella caeni]THU31543.1 AraC family transcriptional regulator [Niastella caeni]
MFNLTVSENILRMVLGLGVLQGMLLAALIYFYPKGDRSVNKFLAGFILGVSAVMALPMIIHFVGWQNSFFVQSFPLIPGPFLYLYIRSFKETITWRKAWPHFIICIIWLIPIYFNLLKFSKLYPDSEMIPIQALRSPTTIFLIMGRPVLQVVYYWLARRELISYQRSLRHLFSETSRLDLNWAKFLVNGFLVLVGVFFISFPLLFVFPNNISLILLTNMSVGAPYIYIATYLGIKQYTIWQAQPGVNKETAEATIQKVVDIETNGTNGKKPKPVKTAQSDDRMDVLVKKIIALMEEEKLYQEAELTLQQVANKLQVPAYQVSQALNEGMMKSFYDVVNNYRVEDAKRLLLDEKSRNHTILSIGFEAGFNSKTTFNTVFKKFTGLTPTEFREKQNVLTTAS